MYWRSFLAGHKVLKKVQLSVAGADFELNPPALPHRCKKQGKKPIKKMMIIHLFYENAEVQVYESVT